MAKSVLTNFPLLEKLIDEKGLNLSKMPVATNGGVSRSALQNYKKQRVAPIGLGQFHAIAIALGQTYGELKKLVGVEEDGRTVVLIPSPLYVRAAALLPEREGDEAVIKLLSSVVAMAETGRLSEEVAAEIAAGRQARDSSGGAPKRSGGSK